MNKDNGQLIPHNNNAHNNCKIPLRCASYLCTLCLKKRPTFDLL